MNERVMRVIKRSSPCIKKNRKLRFIARTVGGATDGILWRMDFLLILRVLFSNNSMSFCTRYLAPRSSIVTARIPSTPTFVKTTKMAICWWKVVRMKIVFILIGFKNRKIARIVRIATIVNFVTSVTIAKNATMPVFCRIVGPVTTHGF